MEPPSPLPNDEMASQVFDGKNARRSDTRALPPEVELDRRIQDSPIATVTFDRSGRVSSCNAAAEQLYGARKGGLLGKTLPALKTKGARKPHSGGSFNAAEAHSQ
jgi:PAS domain-containing protein